MSAFLFAVAIFHTLGVMVTVQSVGKPRAPVTNGVASATVVINGAIVAGLVVAALGWD